VLNAWKNATGPVRGPAHPFICSWLESRSGKGLSRFRAEIFSAGKHCVAATSVLEKHKAPLLAGTDRAIFHGDAVMGATAIAAQ
jgi:hypothetical protein